MADFEFAILGAGAMGSIIGAHLARAGHTVAMLARGERARQLEERGLAIRGLAEFSTPVRTLRDPAALESAGTLIVATKTPGTAQALEPLRRAELGVALSVQNGPLKNEILVQAFGRERVLAAEGLHEDLVLQRPILDRQGDAELGPAQRLERLGGARRLGRDDERAGALEGRRIAERAHRRAELGEPPDRESALLELTRALAARQHRNRMPGARQMGPDDRAHRAGAENCELEIGHGGVRATATRRCPA